MGGRSLALAVALSALFFPQFALASGGSITKGPENGVDRAWSQPGAGLAFEHSQPRKVPPLPIVLNAGARAYVDSFLAHSGALESCFEQSSPFISEMASALEKRGVPSDFVYLAFAESSFSRLGAGPWQLSRVTARRFGLRINRFVDERRDPVKSTEAAAKYLAALHDQVGDWRTTVAVWNTGEANIDRFVFRHNVDYEQWLARLPGHTRALLNRFIAVAFIAHQALHFGFFPVDLEHRKPVYRRIAVPGNTPLAKVAMMAHTTPQQVHRLNPAFLRDRTPPGNQWSVLVPAEGQDDRVSAAF